MKRVQSSLACLLRGNSLRLRSSADLFRSMLTGALGRGDAKAVLLLLARKGEGCSELEGCLRAVRSLEPGRLSPLDDLMDTCGTGGDRRGTLNVSTLAALVIAAGGGHVAKHGNRAISSRSGSSDLMESLGVDLAAGVKRMTTAVKRFGIGYFHAPYYHPYFAGLQPLRRELGVRTILNSMGPLINPFRLRYQLVGVARREWQPLYAHILAKSGIRKAWVCHSRDGLDEISISAPTRIAEVRSGKVRYRTLRPAALGFRPARMSAFAGGTTAFNRKISIRVLTGKERGPRAELVAINAGAGLWISGHAKTLAAGISAARALLRSGKAFAVLRQLAEHTKKK